MRQCCEAAMARVNTSLTVACTPRRSRREMHDDAVLTVAHSPARRVSTEWIRVSASFVFRPRSDGRADMRLPHGSMTRLRCPPLQEASESGRCPARLRPAGRARLLSSKTQYKCGQSGVRNNHPLGKTKYDRWLLLASGSSLSWKQKAAGTGLSNGVHMLVHSATDGSTKTAASLRWRGGCGKRSERWALRV
jgi:hypothetical protein